MKTRPENQSKKDVSNILVGAFVPRPVADRLSLRCTYEGKGKSGLIREMLTEYLIIGPGDQEMCEALARQLHSTWVRWGEAKNMSLSQIQALTDKKLNEAGLSPKHVETIKKLIVKYTKEDRNNGTN